MKTSFFPCGAATQRESWPPYSWGFLNHTQRRTTIGRTPLDEWSARRRDLYLTTHNTHNRQISMPSVGFEPKISAGERLQTYALDRAATGIGRWRLLPCKLRGKPNNDGSTEHCVKKRANVLISDHNHNHNHQLHKNPSTFPLDFSSVLSKVLTHCGRVRQICVFNMVKLGTSASSP